LPIRCGDLSNDKAAQVRTWGRENGAGLE